MDRFSPHISKMQIRNLFETYGDVHKVVISSDTAFIQMPEKKRARIAIQNLDGMIWRGWSIKLKKLDTNPNNSNLGVN